MADLVLKQGEAKTVTFTVTDNDTGTAIDLTGCTLAFAMRMQNTIAIVVSKVDVDFGRTGEATGVVTIFLTGTDTNQAPGNYVGELKIVFTSSPVAVDKSVDLEIIIQRATN
jgi:hypothetical protein